MLSSLHFQRVAASSGAPQSVRRVLDLHAWTEPRSIGSATLPGRRRMIRIDDRVWKHWEEVEPFGRPGVDLLFSSGLGEEEALAAVKLAADGTIRELETRPPRPTGEPSST